MSTISEKLNRIENSMNSIRSTFGLHESNIEDVAANTSNIYTSLNNEVNTLNESVADRENQITSLNETITSKDVEIGTLNETIVSKDTEITELNTSLSESQHEVIMKDVEINQLNETITEKDYEIAQLKSTIVLLKEGACEYTLGEPFPITGEPVTLPAGTVLALKHIESSANLYNVLSYAVNAGICTYGGQNGLMQLNGLEFIDWWTTSYDYGVYKIQPSFINLISVYNVNNRLYEPLDSDHGLYFMAKHAGTHAEVNTDELLQTLHNTNICCSCLCITDNDTRAHDKTLYIKFLEEVTLNYKNDEGYLNLLNSLSDDEKFLYYAKLKTDNSEEESEAVQNVQITVVDENDNDLSSMEYCIGLNVVDLSDNSVVFEQNTNNNAMIIELKANQEYLVNVNSINGPKTFNLPATVTFTANAGTGEVQDIRIAVSEAVLDISQYDNYNYSLGEAYSVDDEYITIQAGEVIAFKGYDNANCSSSLNVNYIIQYLHGKIVGLIGASGNEYDFGLISTLKDKFAILNPQTSTFKTLDNYVMMYRYNSNDLTLSSCPVDPTNRMPDGNLYLLALETFESVNYYVENKEFFRENPILYKAVSTPKNQEEPEEENYILGINIIDENTGEHFNSDYNLEVCIKDENENVVATPTGQSPMDVELPAGNYTVTLENVFVAGSNECAPYECPVTESVTLDTDKAVTIQPTYVASEPDWNLTVNIVDSDTNETLNAADYKANFSLYETSSNDNLLEETGLNYWTVYTFNGLPESGTYKVVLTELVCENENAQKYEIINDGTISNISLSENTTVNIQVNKVESIDKPETTVSTARYILTDNEIPMRTMVPAGTIIGIKNLNNGAQIYEEGLYEILSNMEYPIVGCTGRPLNTSALLQKQEAEFMGDRTDLYLGCCTDDNSFEVYNYELDTFVQTDSCRFFVIGSDEDALVMPSERHAYSSEAYNNVNGDIFFRVVEPFEPSYHAELYSQSIYNYFKVYYAEENPNYSTILENTEI